jgi:hypothetical protein
VCYDINKKKKLLTNKIMLLLFKLLRKYLVQPLRHDCASWVKKKIRMEIVDLKDEAGKASGTRVEFGVPVVVR